MTDYGGTSLLSAGIDIGTTTTHLTVSRLEITNVSSAYRVPRLSVGAREIIYQSRVYFTPLLDDGSIDGAGVARIVAQEYQTAGIQPSDITSGAAIITGETAQLRNAPQVVEELARFAGDFVVASAGVHLESVLAGMGSGAARSSADRHKTICNIDIGGGTTNLAVFSMGKPIDTACIGIGGRCLVFNERGAVVKITESGHTFFEALNKIQYITPGERLQEEQLELFGNLLAEAIVRSVVNSDPPPISQRMFVTDLLRYDYQIDEFWLSGGVAEMINDHENLLRFNDMGGYLASGLREAFNQYGLCWHVPATPVRATVIGAGMHTMQLSGSTISVQPETLPLRNLPVVKLSVEGESAEGQLRKMQLALQQSDELRKYSLEHHAPLALAIEPLDSLCYQNLKTLAQTLRTLHRSCSLSAPLVVIMAQDVAMALGQLIRQVDPQFECVVLDGVRTEYGDFVDIGRPLPGAATVPVVVKTLVFR